MMKRYIKVVLPIKKLISFILAISLILALFAIPTNAAGETFVAIGNTVLPLGGPAPIYSSGVWYIDYQNLTTGGLVSSSYNSAERTLVLYTWDTTLIFNLNETTAHTVAEKVKYKAVSFTSSGTVYVPAQFTAQMLGFDYNFLADIPMIRIKRSSDIPNDIFLYMAEKAAKEELERYNASKNNQQSSQQGNSDKPSVQEPDSQENQNTEKKYIALTFNIKDGKNFSKILDSLSRYGYRAAFFIQGSAIPNCEDAIRRAVAMGHTIGTLSENGDADFILDVDAMNEKLNLANTKLFDIAKIKTRLVRIPSGSKNIPEANADALIAKGYRIWDQSILPAGSSGNGIYNSAISRLSSAARSTVMTLDDSDASLNALSRLLRYFSSNNFSVYAIDLLDAPVNAIGKHG